MTRISRSHRLTLLPLALLAVWAIPGHAMPEGSRTLMLQTSDGTPLTLGSVDFEPGEEGATYQISWDQNAFEDHQFSGQTYSCLTSGDMLWCRIPYPYEIARMVTDENYADLEHDLLFAWVDADASRLDPWNGAYYRLAVTEAGLIGLLHEFDLTSLTVPPAKGNANPLNPDYMLPADPRRHAYPTLELR